MFFRVLLGIDIVASAIVIYFFFAGLADGSVSDFNIGLWTVVLLGLAAILVGGLALKRAAWNVPAAFVLAILAVPALLYGLFILIVIGSGVSWN